MNVKPYPFGFILIDEKIALWKSIMDYAHDRGIEVFVITWNIHMGTARAKHGIRESAHNATDIDYLRKSVAELFFTYPRLAGIGVTSGENMKDMTADEKEAWLWETYGKGIQDVHAAQPGRHIRFIHRFWLTDFDKIDSRFGRLRDGFDMSYKYARTRLYSSPAPPFAEKELFPHIPSSMATWWNLRNDDIYNLRWGDPEYVREFILNLPKGDRTAGYYMGSDRYAWDYLWWPEAGISSGAGKAIAGYHDIHAFIDAPVMEGSGFVGIGDYVDSVLRQTVVQGKTPLEVADMIEASAKTALATTEGMVGEGDNELSETIGDIRAMAYLGQYYAAKIRGGTNLALYVATKEAPYKTAAVRSLKDALGHWQAYAEVLDAQYIMMNIAIQRVFDWDRIEIEVREDIQIAREAE